MEKDFQVYYGIKEIKETGFSIDESIDFTPTTKYACQYHVNLQSIVADGTITFTVTSTFTEQGGNRIFMTGKSFTRFAVQDLKKYSRMKGGVEVIDLPDPMWVNLFSLSYSHARALLTRNAVGTKFSAVMLPLIDPAQAFRENFAPEVSERG